MKLPGYWVFMNAGKVVLQKATFDETELDPATQWKQAWQNQDDKGEAKGYVHLGDALVSAASLLASTVGRPLSREELDQVARFEPAWHCDRCEISSLTHLLSANVSSVNV